MESVTLFSRRLAESHPGSTPEPDGVRRDRSAGSGRLDRSGRPLRAHRPRLCGPRSLAQWAARSAPGGVGRDRRAAEPPRGPGPVSALPAPQVSELRGGRRGVDCSLCLHPLVEEDGASARPAPRRSVPRDLLASQPHSEADWEARKEEMLPGPRNLCHRERPLGGVDSAGGLPGGGLPRGWVGCPGGGLT